MRISSEKLSAEAESTGFRPDVLEKAAHMLNLLDALRSHPFLENRLALKGGSALNLFVFEVPRLSVDIDLNYVGAEDREIMLRERPKVEQAIQAVSSREGFLVGRMPEEHAGGKWRLGYQAASGQTKNLELDINFMYRTPLWPITTLDSHSVGSWRATGISVLDIHELAAGKLAALLSRHQARDLFDSQTVLHLEELDMERLRLAFVVYGAMNRKDWRSVSVEDVDFDVQDLAARLAPTLRAGEIGAPAQLAEYGRRLVQECRLALSAVLPFTRDESEFLNILLDNGQIDPSLLTADAALQERIQRHPLLEWKALNVRRYKRGT